MGDSKILFSKDSVEDYGPKSYTLTFRKAINLGVIADYKIIVSVVNAKSVLKISDGLEDKVVALKKAILKRLLVDYVHLKKGTDIVMFQVIT